MRVTDIESEVKNSALGRSAIQVRYVAPNGDHPHTSIIFYSARKLATSFFPASVSTLSGWNCTPSTA